MYSGYVYGNSLYGKVSLRAQKVRTLLSGHKTERNTGEASPNMKQSLAPDYSRLTNVRYPLWKPRSVGVPMSCWKGGHLIERQASYKPTSSSEELRQMTEQVFSNPKP